MPIALDPEQAWEYRLRTDAAAGSKAVLRGRYLTLRQRRQARQILEMVDRIGDEQGGEATIDRVWDAMVKLLSAILVGWDGCGTDYRPESIEDVLTDGEMLEIISHASAAQPTIDDAKNCRPPSHGAAENCAPDAAAANPDVGPTG